jgi:hypothetical protein
MFKTYWRAPVILQFPEWTEPATLSAGTGYYVRLLSMRVLYIPVIAMQLYINENFQHTITVCLGPELKIYGIEQCGVLNSVSFFCGDLVVF